MSTLDILYKAFVNMVWVGKNQTKARLEGIEAYTCSRANYIFDRQNKQIEEAIHVLIKGFARCKGAKIIRVHKINFLQSDFYRL